uniref:Protein TIC 20 n=1 Tax=Micromonas pusilla TaxID=38833 RepID=A0A7S0KS14_MICPS
MIAHAQPRATSAAPTAAVLPRVHGHRVARVVRRAPGGTTRANAPVVFQRGIVHDDAALRATPAVPAMKSRRACVTTHARYGSYDGRGGGTVPIPDRIVALLPYLVPLLDGLRYSRFFFSQFPQAIVLLTPLQPIASMYFSIPFAGLISFFAIYMGMAENRTLSRFVRFNAMQAIILDICLVLPGMVEYVFSPGRLSGLGFELYRLCYNSVWLFVLFAFALAAIGCLSGQTYRLPFIGEAADMRV